MKGVFRIPKPSRRGATAAALRVLIPEVPDPAPPIELLTRVRRFHLHQYGYGQEEAAEQRSKNVLRWMMESTRGRENESNLKKMVDEYVLKHMPLAYILGDQPFCGINVQVEPPILIPRPETEEWVMNLIKKMEKTKNDIVAPARVLDLCTGSGCISLALAKHAPRFLVTGLDISKKAIQVATANSDRLGFTNTIFKQVDIFDDNALEQANLARYDLIVSNPPYITPKDYEKLDRSVKDYEDRRALVGQYRAHGTSSTSGPVSNQDGLDFYRRIREIATRYLAPSARRALSEGIPRMVLEFGKGQDESVKEIFGVYNSKILKDFNEIERTIEVYSRKKTESKL